MNVAIGSTAILVGVFVAAAAIAVIVVGLVNKREDMLRTTPVFAGLLFASALVAFAIMERALI
ncbi:MAG: hypothetical protein JST73_06290, partial [Actinobacteria bacterium]|nr:hypothetical protein [Actinomycetota bacterium]